MYIASDISNDGEYTGHFCYYGVKQMSDGNYGIDYCVSEEGLFKAGEDRMYVITEIKDNEIISYEEQDDYGAKKTYSRE